MSLPVHNGARRGGAGTLWVRMASLRAIAPATFASSRRSGDASAPKTRCVATVARRGAASGRAESALTRKVRHSPRGPAPGRIHSRLSPPFEEPFAFTRAALAARFARAAPRRAPRARGREASTFENRLYRSDSNGTSRFLVPRKRKAALLRLTPPIPFHADSRMTLPPSTFHKKTASGVRERAPSPRRGRRARRFGRRPGRRAPRRAPGGDRGSQGAVVAAGRGARRRARDG